MSPVIGTPTGCKIAIDLEQFLAVKEKKTARCLRFKCSYDLSTVRHKPTGAVLNLTPGNLPLSRRRGNGRDAAIRPNKTNRFRAGFLLFSPVLAHLLMKSDLQHRLESGMRLGIPGSVRFGKWGRLLQTKPRDLDGRFNRLSRAMKAFPLRLSSAIGSYRSVPPVTPT